MTQKPELNFNFVFENTFENICDLGNIIKKSFMNLINNTEITLYGDCETSLIEFLSAAVQFETHFIRYN